ncbi:transcriptional regulator, GntR family [Kutzneria sp. 744]|nr:transcriptional regulator, GntR family [Kutzneria sp. 744]
MNEDNAEQGVIRLLRAAAHTVGPGGRLPSVRTIMAELRVSPVTVQHAMRRLTAEGVIEVRASKGAFAATRRPTSEVPDLEWQSVALGAKPPGDESLRDLLTVPGPEMVPMSGGYLDPELQSVAALGAALGRAARRPEAWARGPVEGREELRAWFARQAGGAFRAGDMVVCPGGQAALSTAFRALTEPGDPVLVEAPTYLGAIATARSAGLRVVPVPADADGVRPDLLNAAFARTGAKVFYCQPLYANPHGAVLSRERRPEVLAVLAKHGAFLIEDDFARDLVIDGTPPPPLAADDIHGHVIYLRSLTKSAAPGLRVAAIGARGAAGARLRSARVMDDFFVAGPLQLAALEISVIASMAASPHLAAAGAEGPPRRAAHGVGGQTPPTPARHDPVGRHAGVGPPAGRRRRRRTDGSRRGPRRGRLRRPALVRGRPAGPAPAPDVRRRAARGVDRRRAPAGRRGRGRGDTSRIVNLRPTFPVVIPAHR